MHGQWIGTTALPSGQARVILNIDSDKTTEFMFHVLSEKSSFGLLAKGVWSNDRADLKAIEFSRCLEDGDLFTPNERGLTDEERDLRNGITISLARQGAQITTATWKTGTAEGEVQFPPIDLDRRVQAYRCESWDAFKSWITQLRTKEDIFLYRGHGSHQFRLETSLHRAGRFRLDRYWNEVVPEFRDRTEAAMGVRFEKTSGDDQGIVLGLAQHHGLPTPMLDVTASPYVAAFFAFSDAIESQRDAQAHSHVRVYAFARKFIDALAAPLVSLRRAEVFVNSLGVSSRFNPRLTAQQGKFLVTNVASLESLVRFLEEQTNQVVMFAADIPAACAPAALQDLTFMGLTAATMFPGLDGIGKMMRHQMLFSHKHLDAEPSLQESMNSSAEHPVDTPLKP